PATSTCRLSGVTVTSSGEARPRATAQSDPPAWLTHPAGPAPCVRLPSVALAKIEMALGNLRPATYTRRPFGLTAMLVGSFRARTSVQPPPGRWLKQPAAPGSCCSAPVRLLRVKTLSASLPAAAT